MTNERRVDRRIRTSARHRLNLVEEIVMGIVSFDLSNTAIAVDTVDATWFTDGIHNKEMTNLRKNDVDITWARLTNDGSINVIDLDAGRYKITFQLLVTNTHAAQPMNLRFALTDNTATQVWLAGVEAAGTSEPAVPTGLDNQQLAHTHVDFIEVTGSTNLLQFQLALAAASQTATAVAGGLTKVIIERLG